MGFGIQRRIFLGEMPLDGPYLGSPRGGACPGRGGWVGTSQGLQKNPEPETSTAGIQHPGPFSRPAAQPGCWTGKATPLPPKGLLK